MTPASALIIWVLALLIWGYLFVGLAFGQTPPPYESFHPCPIGNDCDEDGWINPRETRAQTDPFDPCSVPPDLNGDGRVSLADVVSFGPWWNTVPPADATEYARFDLYGDGIVNLTDLIWGIGGRYNTANC